MNENCVWGSALVNPIEVDPPADRSGWVSDTFRRMQPISEFLAEFGADLMPETPEDDTREPAAPVRDEVFGFAVGDRVRVTQPGPAHGYIGKVSHLHACEFARMGIKDQCLEICPTIEVDVTHRVGDDATITAAPGSPILFPASYLEHID